MQETPLVKCTRCKLKKARSEFHVDRSKPKGITSQCAVCRNKKDRNYYAANSQQLIENVLAYRQGSQLLQKQLTRFKSVNVKLHFEPLEVRQAYLAFEKETGTPPTDEQLKVYLERHSRAGVSGHVKYILEMKRGKFEPEPK